MSTTTRAEVFPPGEYLRDEIEARGWTVTEFAQILGRPIQAVSEILNDKKEITAETALEIADALGTSPESWLNLQTAYRLHHARQSVPALTPVARRKRLRSFGPIGEMQKRGWLPMTDDLDIMEAEVTKMFGIASIDDAPNLAFAARRANSHEGASPAQLAWLAQVRTSASTRTACPLDVLGLHQVAAGLSKSLRDGPTALRGLGGTLASVGVVLVVEPGLTGSKFDGAALFTTNGTATVGLTGRYDRFDGFVFTLLHELAHLALGHVTPDSGPLVDEDISGNGDGNDAETEANTQAQDWIFPGGFAIPNTAPPISAIAKVATAFGIHPSMVIGRLQREGVIDWSHLRNQIPKVRPYLDLVDQ